MAVNKVEVNGETKLDLTQDTVTPENLLSGATAHNAAGEQISGAVAVAEASTTTPKAPGTAAVGTEQKYARGDHVHPSDPTKQGINDEIQALRLRGGINSIINNASAVSINPAVNAIGFLQYNGGNVQIFYDGHLMPFQKWETDKLFDGNPAHTLTLALARSTQRMKAFAGGMKRLNTRKMCVSCIKLHPVFFGGIRH